MWVPLVFTRNRSGLGGCWLGDGERGRFDPSTPRLRTVVGFLVGQSLFLRQGQACNSPTGGRVSGIGWVGCRERSF